MISPTLRCLVVDDEPPARRRLVRLLEEDPAIVVVGEASDGEQALAACAELTPDLVFLDVKMPGMDGVTLAHRYGYALPAVVFCTAYDTFAVQAFEVNAVDYLLKPVRPERLAVAVAKVRAGRAASQQSVERTLGAIAPAAGLRVVATTRGVARFFDVSRITRFWSSDKYTMFIGDGEEQLTDEPLGAIEERLAQHGFLRIHRGELVRIFAIKSLLTDGDGHRVELDDGQVARVSRRSLTDVKKALGLRLE
jgi:DNA-binding LytR/AlgR family response regulator